MLIGERFGTSRGAFDSRGRADYDDRVWVD